MMVVTIYATQLHILAVNLKHLTHALHTLHAEMIVEVLKNLLHRSGFQFNTARIEIGLLSRPQAGFVYQTGNLHMCSVANSKAFQESLLHPAIDFKDGFDVLDSLFACVANRDISRHSGLREISIRYSRYVIIGNMHQRTYPQLHLAEDTRKSPHILILQITAVAPAIHLYGEFIAALTHIFRHIKLCRRHRVLTIAHLLTVHPYIESRMHATEMQDQILREHLFCDIDKRHIRAHRVPVLVGRPILWWLTRHAGSVPLEGIADVGIDGCTESLHLPVAGHRNLIPSAHIIILTIEIHRPLFRIPAPMELPLPVETDNLLTLRPFRRQLQRGVIRQFVNP